MNSLRYSESKRLLFHYTGMHWRKKDRALIREIHRIADRYWQEKYYPSKKETI